MDGNTTYGDNEDLVASTTTSFTCLDDSRNGTINQSDECKHFPRTFHSAPLEPKDIFIIHCYALIFLLAVLGNVLVILTLIQNKRMRTVTNVFLLNLSVSDLLLAVFCMPFTIVPMLLKNFIFGAQMCVIIRYFQGKYVS